jgi:hypothetical protein
MHGDGANGSSNIVDVTGKAVTVHGAAQHSTALSKFGGSSIYLDGSAGSYVSLQQDPFQLSSGAAFTIEGWVRIPFAPVTETNIYLCSRRSGANGFYFLIAVSPTTFQPYWQAWSSGGAWNPLYAPFRPVADIVNAFVHVAVTYNGASYLLFVDGIAGSPLVHGAPSATNSPLVLGKDGGAIAATPPMYIDDLRITNVARYTANFTPPTAPFPNN